MGERTTVSVNVKSLISNSYVSSVISPMIQQSTKCNSSEYFYGRDNMLSRINLYYNIGMYSEEERVIRSIFRSVGDVTITNNKYAQCLD